MRFIKTYFWLHFITAAYLWVIISLSDFVPLWDGWVYAGMYLYNAVTKPFNLLNFDLAGHASFLYALLIGLPWYFDPGNIRLLHLTVAFYFILSIYTFYFIAKKFFSEKNSRGELYVLTFLYAFFPPIIGNSLNTNIDFGMLIFYLLFVVFLLYDKKKSALLSAIILVFTKEPAVLLYLFTLVVVSFFRLAKTKDTETTQDYSSIYPSNPLCCPFWLQTGVRRVDIKKETVGIIKKQTIYIIPLLLFAFWMLIRWYVTKSKVLWLMPNEIFGSTIPFDWVGWDKSKITYSYLLAIFVINFNYILSLFVIGGIIRYLITFVRKGRDHLWNLTSLKETGMIFLLFGGTVVILTLFKSFTNLRYFLPVYALLIILFYWSLVTLIRYTKVRRTVLIFITVLVTASSFRTFDPVSKKIYGTFKFGDHDLLKMTSITSECCGTGRDQIVYNLEYTNIHYLLNQAFADLKLNKEDRVAFDAFEGPSVITRIDATTYKRTIVTNNVIDVGIDPIIVSWTYDLLPEKPRQIYFFEYPNTDNNQALNSYLSSYTVEKVNTYSRSGYRMKVYKMQLK